jgi:hypothetical protein
MTPVKNCGNFEATRIPIEGDAIQDFRNDPIHDAAMHGIPLSGRPEEKKRSKGSSRSLGALPLNPQTRLSRDLAPADNIKKIGPAH